MLVSFFITAYIDPGILPRNSKWREMRANNPSDENYWARRKRLEPLKKTVQLDGVTLSLNYCDNCKIYRPLRAHHCRECDCCVENFDHHCPWTGNCIGKRNYRFFLIYVFLVEISALYGVIICIIHFVILSDNTTDPPINFYINQSVEVRKYVSLVIGVFCLVGFLVVGSLASLHIYLVSTAQTTYEYLKNKWKEIRNPFRQSLFRNWMITLCPPNFPSFIGNLSRTDNLYF